jgi:hypothetical protein
MKFEIKVYGKGTKYNSKRCSRKVVKDVYSIKALNNKEVKELEKTLSDGDYDPYHEYYEIREIDGEVSNYRASHTRIIRGGKELFLTKYDVMFSKKFYKHHTATSRDYLTSADDGKIEIYNGRFGNGYIIHRQMNSSKYHLIEYYIKKGE